MNRKQWRAFATTIATTTTTAIATALLLCPPAGAQSQAAPSLGGRWSSAAPEAMGEMFATRDFTFTADRWTIVFRAYADRDGRQPLFTLRNDGAFVLGGPSSKVAGAWEGIFPQTSRVLIADSDAGVAMFAQMGCQLTKGQALAVLQQACGFVTPLMQSMGEYDLIALRNGQLFFGDRSGDLSRARPEQLTAFPLLKR